LPATISHGAIARRRRTACVSKPRIACSRCTQAPGEIDTAGRIGERGPHEANIRDDNAIACDEHVARLQIAVELASAMDRTNSVGKIARRSAQLRLTRRARGH
jgi:hypothetical protein